MLTFGKVEHSLWGPWNFLPCTPSYGFYSSCKISTGDDFDGNKLVRSHSNILHELVTYVFNMRVKIAKSMPYVQRCILLGQNWSHVPSVVGHIMHRGLVIKIIDISLVLRLFLGHVLWETYSLGSYIIFFNFEN